MNNVEAAVHEKELIIKLASTEKQIHLVLNYYLYQQALMKT